MLFFLIFKLMGKICGLNIRENGINGTQREMSVMWPGIWSDPSRKYYQMSTYWNEKSIGYMAKIYYNMVDGDIIAFEDDNYGQIAGFQKYDINEPYLIHCGIDKSNHNSIKLYIIKSQLHYASNCVEQTTTSFHF